MTEPTDALLPCPFCGGAASLHNDTDSPCWFVGCSNSACPIEPCHYADTEAEAIATWNHRTPQPTHAQPVAREPLSDEEVDSLCKVGFVYVIDGKVTRTPTQYRDELKAAQRYGLRKGEHAHGIKGGQHGTE